MSKNPNIKGGHTIVTIFDRAYPTDLQAEGQAVSWSVATGACNKCRHLTVCMSSGGAAWRPPDTAACMQRKKELLTQK